MRQLDFQSYPADPDVCMRQAKNPYGTLVYEYILLYTDDSLAIGPNPENLLHKGMGRLFELKETSIGPPEIYLGGRMLKVEI